MKKTIYIWCVCVLLTSVCEAQCTGVGPRNGSAAQNNSATGSITWTNLTNVLSSDNTYASASRAVAVLSTMNTNYACLKGLGFTIPTEAIICGIKVDIERRAAGISIGAAVSDNAVQLLKTGSLVGTNKAWAANWPTSKATASYGSIIDMWGTTWTPSEINDPNFGVALSARMFSGLISLTLTAYVDNIHVTVYYTAPLPVEVSEFRIQSTDKTVQLHWVTQSETNSSHFSVERSEDTLSWLQLTAIEAQGFSTNVHEYDFEDVEPLPASYYRIRQYDRDGACRIYGPLFSKFTKPLSAFILAPNPAADYIDIYTDEKPVDIFLLTNSGVRYDVIYNTIDEKRIRVDISEVNPGTYLLFFAGQKRNVARRILVERN